MKILGVIPARYASTRFPGKPLVDIGGKSMIRRVYEQASLAKLNKVVVATDDGRIAAEVSGFGGEFVMTDSNHQSGTDRCAEVAAHFKGFDVIVNIQGDEPFIAPGQIDLVSSCFEDNQVQIATLIKEIHSEDELFNPNIPKVTISNQQNAIYFSRHPIPYLRNAAKENWLNGHQFYKHIGIYAYRQATLALIAKLKPSALEKAESLEQLRWIENGFSIRTKLTTIETLAIDSPDDLLKIKL